LSDCSPIRHCTVWKAGNTWKRLLCPPSTTNSLADVFIELDTAEVYEMMQKALRMEGLRLSPSSAANLLGAVKVAGSIESGTVVTVFPDNADKYGDLMTQLGI
jgi:cysteine synthase B